VQVYTAYLGIPRKVVHGGPNVEYGERSTVAIEQKGWVDAINTPEWGVNQICEL
jgi:aldose 1-epimerase